MSDKCAICKDVKPHSKKDRSTRLKHLLLELALWPPSELSISVQELRTSVSANSTPLVLPVVRGRLMLLVLRKRHWKSDLVPGSLKA